MPIRQVLAGTLAGLALVSSGSAADAAPLTSYDGAACPPVSTSSSRTVEVDMGPDAEPEAREEFTVHARGRGLRVKIELGFVGAAPRWSGTALVRYVVRPLR